MGSEYDCKFEEMKMYIPFLESMIKRLESNTASPSSNPRQAQLDKIRSLRDLLLDKKKRMKMDNLLKCEQVLVNLYAKVEQRNTLPAIKVESMDSRGSKDNSDLEAVRNKLKSVVKMQNVTETLPEIARASEIEEICEPGSKEPALFQRRPNRSSLSPIRLSPKNSNKTKIISPKSSKRYTRVLVSPEPRPLRWPANEETSTEKQLFSRRSPRRSPRRNSPSYHKKERKKSSKSKDGKLRKDLNITLKVPEESLDSLNTKDIVSRIITCSDGDVDIDTLRELRSEILSELKQTGRNDDISELILKSYNKKSKLRRKKKHEVEEGEISDSESEAIQNIYGSLVIDKDKKLGPVKTASEESNRQRKIQICLVINADKEEGNKPQSKIDLSESGVFENNSKNVICIDSDASLSPDKKKDKVEINQSQANADDDFGSKSESGKEIITETIEYNKCDHVVDTGENKNDIAQSTESADIFVKKSSDSSVVFKNEESLNKRCVTPTKILYSPSHSSSSSPVKLQTESKTSEPTKNIANFYKPQPENVDKTLPRIDTGNPDQSQKPDNAIDSTAPTTPTKENDSNKNKTEDSMEIPLLNEPILPPKATKDVLSEIDILQALKNEILSETISIAATEADIPALHKPKITKVASSTETGTSALQPKITNISSSSGMTKKRISIENYKKKSETVAKSLFVRKRSNAAREEMKKQSLKLTEKECERFNFSARSSLDDDSDISDDDLLEDDKALSLDDIYGDLAPESPDQDNFDDDLDEAPVLIPADPVKTPDVASTTDVDMRSLPTPPPHSVQVPVPTPSGFVNVVAPTLNTDNQKSALVFEPNKVVPEGNRIALVDPRLRRDLSQPASKESSNPYRAIHFEGTPRSTPFPNIPPLLGPSMTPVYTPSYTPSMTPVRTPNARSYEMTPSHQPFEMEEPQQKHVYAPSFSMSDNRDRDFSVAKERPIWEPNKTANSNDDYRHGRDARNSRWDSSRGSSTQMDSQSNYSPRSDKYHFEHYSKSDCPSTPVPSFGWTDCPGTPGSSFGRLERPMTPSHPFGRSDCPPTPSHPFGRSECPPTPNHPFGRSDFKDPRLNRRQSDYNQPDEKDRRYDHSYIRSNSYKSHSRPYSGSDSARNYDRDQHFGRIDRYSNEQGSRYSKSNVSDASRIFEREDSIGRTDKNYFNETSGRDIDSARHCEPSLNRSLPRNDSNRLYTRNRDGRYDSRYSDSQEEIGLRRNQRERSIGRAMPGGESIRASSRAPSVGKSEYDNSLSVKPHAGRSFTIDTSVNATFQNLIESGKGIQVFDNTFDARRQRAVSVGRSLVRESSVGRTPSHKAKSREAKSTDSTSFQRRNFQRASSVGRVHVGDKDERSFNEIKADFKSFRLNSSENIKHSKQNAKQQYSPRKNYRDPRMRKDQKDLRNKNDRGSSHSWDRRHPGIVYSNDNIAKGTIMGTGFGVKNYKIPKIKRPEPELPKTPAEDVIKVSEKVKKINNKTELVKKIKSIDKKDKDKHFDVEVSEKVDTNTPSAKTTNEKNYKGNNSDDGFKNKNKPTKQKDNKIAIISDDDSEKRVTRSCKKNDSYNLEEEHIKKTKRIRKTFIDDSDSDVETEIETKNENIKTKSKPKLIKEPEMSAQPKISESYVKTKRIDQSDKKSSKSTLNKESQDPVQQKTKAESEDTTIEKELRKTLEEDSLDSSFAIDDLEMFSDTIVSDPVMDNINKLIADLDHDLGAAKSENDGFNTEMDKIMGDIDNQEENTLGDISELIEKDLNESNEKLNQNDIIEPVTGPPNTTTPTGPQNTTTPIEDAVVANKESHPQNNINITPKVSIPTVMIKAIDLKVCADKLIQEKGKHKSVILTASIDEIVSTTHTDLSNSNLNRGVIGNKTDQTSNDYQFPPDSTIVQNNDAPDKPEESIPDSTVEIHSEVSSDVTSTLNDAGKNETAQPSLSRKEVSAIESFGSLLSILQDKSKIKQLLSMLGDQPGESDKIKKKLEKLSEIVSDEDDANDDQNRDFDNQTDEKITAKTMDKQKEAKKKTDSDKSYKGELIKDVPHNDKKDTQTDNNKAKCVQADILEEKIALKNAEDPIDPLAESSLDQTHDDNSYDMNEVESTEYQFEEVNKKVEKTVPKKTKVSRTGKGRYRRSRANPTNKKSNIVKAQKLKSKPRKITRNRELQTLQNDIQEMFIRDDVLNATGIRMCRLAKMVDKKVEMNSPKDESVLSQKSKGTESLDEPVKKIRKKPGPKPKPKIVNDPTTVKKSKSFDTDNKIDSQKSIKPGPKSRTKQKHKAVDPYAFESDSVADINTTKEIDGNSSSSESDSLASSCSFGSSEVLSEIRKKPKKKRFSWQSGVIKPRYKKKKDQDASNNTPEVAKRVLPLKPVTIPDMNCFTDKMYCFQRGVITYDCRLCHYSGMEIASHYKKQHAHTEVPLSRIDPDEAKKAIQQCEDINFQAISKIPSEKYTCRFCYKEFSKNRAALEAFFWHVVSTHTGEFKQLCYECVNVTRCPFNLDIPPPPKEIKGQLIGYICGKCNFTQISLENLKTHVIVRHNDEQTEVYTINLGVISQKAMKAMLRQSLGEEQKPRNLRSSRSNQSAGTVEVSDDRSEITISDRLSEVSSAGFKLEEADPYMDAALAEVKRKIKSGPIKSKLRYETDDQEHNDETSVKLEGKDDADYQNETSQLDDALNGSVLLDENLQLDETSESDRTGTETGHLDESSLFNHICNTTVESDHTQNGDPKVKRGTGPKANINTSKVPKPRGTDVFEQPHFKLNYKETGAKEYVCCVKGLENHYKTTLLISLKKHVQTKHSEIWDGYCCVCKVIVTLQGVQSSFKDCLTHFLDKHMDDFPVLEKVVDNTNEDSRSSLTASIDASTAIIERTESPRTYIAVRPLSDLISNDVDEVDPPLCEDNGTSFPIIGNVVSLGDNTVDIPQASPVYPNTSAKVLSQLKKPFQYEEVQAEVMSKKHRIVLDTMMPKEMLVRVFKCAGRFCSFTSDSAEDALVHASAHKQMGGEGALDCAYCNFDAAGNAIDLVMHVFKEHGRCQYSCVMCFYRAAADQLVGAHFSKAHCTTGEAARVLRTTSAVAPAAADTANMLSRETAVPYYICNHGEGSCKFRTYTPGKLCEHLQQKHGSEESHPCNLCEVTTPTPSDLVKHMTNHGVKLYQCTWCVHGANSEPEMLSHAASVHPTKNPQAYLRIITNKDGFTELRVLPLIYLNKLKVPIEDVTPSKVNENPTREAERSIELEKLIKHTTLMLDTNSVNFTADPTPESPEVTEPPTKAISESGDLIEAQTVEALEKSLLPSPVKTPQNATEPGISAVKDEPDEGTPSLNQRTDIVYCLDSDEEESVSRNSVTNSDTVKQAVIDLSDEEPAAKLDRDTPVLQRLVSEPASSEAAKTPTKLDKPKFIKLSLDNLFKCPSCDQISKNVGGFKKHTNICCLELSTFRCPHAPCPIVLSNITQLINHYNKDHNLLNIAKQYYCGVCNSRWSTLNLTKKHLKDAHNVLKVVITSKIGEEGICAYTVDKETRPVTRELPKRKASMETLKKFGIEDIDKLPINPIMDSLVYCNICEFSTKVRVNMVRHLQLHAERQPVPQTAPVNPVPHLETNEKHFDKMVNLASSSAATRSDKPPAVTSEASSRYPKYVPDRQRHTCGAKGCSYISVDEAMLRCHWETLHSGAVDYLCVHCPPHQHLDTSKLLTASRILAHLKMHDASLYACSSCFYYHYKKQIVEKHVNEVHKDKGGQVQIVREEGTNVNPVLQASAGVGALGTMDLKPWQCGLCEFKSMLRQSVVEHCSKHHQTKMQYKCAYCPFRTSAIENIVKHQSNAHPAKAEDVFYFYYREGTVPNEADGTPRWHKQRQKCGIQETEVKAEPEPDTSPAQPLPKTVPIDLNLVKKEVNDFNVAEVSVEDLCKQYGQFCEPNGISFKCSLCKTVTEYTRDAMQSHLYEELKYRRWSCAMCTYKAYHRAGLNDHIASEHSRNFIEPSELPVNVNIEKWVSKLLDHQSAIIDKNKVNAKQKISMEKPIAGPSKVVEPPKLAQVFSGTELEQAFGCFGTPEDDSYSCPKCKTSFKDEDEMRNHLESELTKIRWCCTKCTDKFPTFHEAQFHCKSHPGLLSRPKEAIRDPSLRAAWVSAVINAQKQSMKPNSTEQQHIPENIDLADTSDNSLLVVRYEEAAPTDEQLREIAREEQLRELSRKRPVPSDSEDEEGMVIYEPESKKINNRNCPYCEFVTRSHQYKLCMKEHILRHYNLKVLTCSHCPFNSSRKSMYSHLQTEHPGLPHQWKQTEIPNVLPSEYNLKGKKNDKKTEEELPKKVCLHCEASVSMDEMITHLHGNKPSEFGDKGEVVVKCCICLTLRQDLKSMQGHYKEAHSDINNLNYAYYKLQIDTREVQSCGICNRRFTFLRDLRIHHSAMHGTFNLSYNTVPYRPEEDDHEHRGKRKLEDANHSTAKRIAKKSTSKLPSCNTIAKKSTSKLPSAAESDSDDEFSYYGTKPSTIEQFKNVKTSMPVCNTIVEIDVKKLSGILKIDPKVVVNDFKKSSDE